MLLLSDSAPKKRKKDITLKVSVEILWLTLLILLKFECPPENDESSASIFDLYGGSQLGLASAAAELPHAHHGEELDAVPPHHAG